MYDPCGNATGHINSAFFKICFCCHYQIKDIIPLNSRLVYSSHLNRTMLLPQNLDVLFASFTFTSFWAKFKPGHYLISLPTQPQLD